MQSKKGNDEGQYTYPVTDHDTDLKIEKQDPEKSTKEHSFISEILNWDWEIAIDFGCGTGANFAFFNKEDKSEATLIGLDPDCVRARVAHERATRLSTRIKIHVICGDVGFLENAPSGLDADIVLCSQVLGHVSTDQMKRILNGFCKILKPSGRCGVLIPVIGSSFKDDESSGDWDGTCDFTHLVDISQSPSNGSFRTHVSFEEYDNVANKPMKNVLPVRSFLINEFPSPAIATTPFEMKDIPESISSVTQELFQVEKAVLYSIHRDTIDSTAPIGDLIIQFRKL
ncbi:MAG: class I SAM-dependent methyltransferase [Candidatus Thorarchaeota archaeon]